MMSTNTSMEIASRKIKVNHIEDRLSNLPNEIVTKILSYLTTKEAVRTGILSTQWKSVWASVPTLRLSDYDFKLNPDDYRHGKVKNRFSNFVDRVLVARKLPLLEKMSIKCQDVDSNIMISWIRAALERNVSDLYVVFNYIYSLGPSCELTQNLFSYNKLVVLKLSFEFTLYFPPASSCFPNLKTLELEDIYYRDDNSLPNLLSSCPILEDLVITRSRCDNMETVNLTSHSLKRLKVWSYTKNFEEEFDVMETVIDASAVESIDISSNSTYEYVVKDLSSIVEAKLELCDDYYPLIDMDYNVMCLFEFLKGISNAKFLTLEASTMQFLVSADSYKLPMFLNLTRLEIHATEHGNYELTNYSELALMLKILKSSPVLEILILRAFTFSSQECGKASDWDVPDCLVSHLKTVEINFNYESDYDMEKVKYFLKNAQVLEKMIIVSSHSTKLFNDISDVISKNPKSSVTCSEGRIIISFL